MIRYNCIICNIDTHYTKDCLYRCTVCNGNHLTILHKCSICNTIGANHTTSKCPLRCPCNGFHTIYEHRCFYCCVRNPDHKETECNFRFNTRRV